MVPLQVIWTKTSQRRATGTSLAAIVPISIAAAGVYYFAKGAPQLDLTVAFFVMLGSSAGAVIGSLVARWIPDRQLKMLVVALLLVAALKELYDGVVGGEPASSAAASTNLGSAGYLLVSLTGVLIGTLSGLSGVGGGTLFVPTLVLGFGIGQRVAQGTSLLAVLPTAALGAAVHQRHGDVDFGAAGRMALTGVPAALVGAALALWLPQRVLAGLFGLLLVVLAARLWPARDGAA